MMDPSFNSQSYAPDRLIAGDSDLITKDVTILSGQDLGRGAVLGRVLRAAPATGTAGDGDTGNATLTVNGMGHATKVGTYTLTCTSAPSGAGANDAVFSVVDPDGGRLQDLTQGVNYSNDHLDLDLGDVADTDHVVGDSFTVAISAGSKKCVIVDSTNVDGSEHPYAVLAKDTDASAGDAVTPTYVAGTFNEDSLSFGGTDTADTHRDAMREAGMHLKAPVSA